MRLRRLSFLTSVGLPAAVAAACSATNGEAIPSEVRDASALDVGTGVVPDSSSSSSDAAGEPDDAGASDAAGDADAAVTSAAVRINEVYVDRTASGATYEWIELAGPEGTPIDDLALRIVDAEGKASTFFDVGGAGAKIGSSGTWVIGGALSSGRVDRLVTTPQGWNLDTRGAAQLVRGPGHDPIDVVGWTDDPDAGAAPEPASAPKAVSEGKPFVLSGGTDSFGRTSSGADTDDNAADLCIETKSCGEANGACL